MSVVHGGNIYELSARAGCSPDEILDFSASINPLALLPAWPGFFPAVFTGWKTIPIYTINS